MDWRFYQKQKISHFFATGLLLIVSLPFSFASAGESITVAVHDYPPYYDKNARGMMSEIYQAAFQKMGIRAHLQSFPVKRGLVLLFDNRVDAFSPGHILMNAEMKQKTDWRNSFVVAMVMIYYKPNRQKDFIKFSSLEDLRGRRVAILVNSPYRELYKKHGLIVFEVETPQQMIQMVKRGYVDFYVNTLLSGLIQIKKEFPEEWDNFGHFIWNRLQCSLAVSRGNPGSKKYLDLFDKGFSQIKKDGTYISILEKYWGAGNIPEVVLFEDLIHHGVEHFSVTAFQTPKRKVWGEIIKDDTKNTN